MASSEARLCFQSLVQLVMSHSTPSTVMFLAVSAVSVAPPSLYCVQMVFLTALLYLTLPNLVISLLTLFTTSSRLPPMVESETDQFPVQGVTITVPSLGPRSALIPDNMSSLFLLSITRAWEH